jgi:hypothetical protein
MMIVSTCVSKHCSCNSYTVVCDNIIALATLFTSQEYGWTITMMNLKYN